MRNKPLPPSSDRSDSGPVGFQLHAALGLDTADRHADLLPATLAAIKDRGLKLRDEAGQGGYGRVYRATDLRANLDRAVKVVLAPQSETAMASYQRELKVLASATCTTPDHQRILPEYSAYGEPPGGQPFLVMEWIDGQNLQDYIAARPGLPMAQRELLCERIFEAYHALHGANLLHRDVSFKNIMIQKGGRIRLIDMGSACRLEPGYNSLQSLSKVPLNHAFASVQMSAGETRGSPAHEVHAIANCCFYLLTSRLAHELDRNDWRGVLLSAGVDLHVTDRIILPRMQQPPEELA